MGRGQKSPFFQAKRLYFYFYDGRYQRTKDGIIDIYEKTDEVGKYKATLTICSVSPNGRSSEVFYTGKVLYSDMLIRFSFVNQYNPLEEDLLYIFNAPVAYVLSIQFHDFFKVRYVASSANLPHSGKAWFCCETSTVMELVFLPFIYSWWTSTYQRHIASLCQVRNNFRAQKKSL